MRETIIRFRVSDIELNKLRSLIEATGLTSTGEAMRQLVDRAYDERILGIKRPCGDRPTAK